MPMIIRNIVAAFPSCLMKNYTSIIYLSRVPMYYSFPSRHSDGYRLQLDSFLDVVNGRGESSVTDKMTIAISRIADACEKSARYDAMISLICSSIQVLIFRTGKPITLEWKADEIPSGYVAVKKSD